jgi:hypothetical protein
VMAVVEEGDQPHGRKAQRKCEIRRLLTIRTGARR